MSTCVACGAALEEATLACGACGRLLAGMRQVAQEPLQEEAAVGLGLLESARFHPPLACVEGNGRPASGPPATKEGSGVDQCSVGASNDEAGQVAAAESHRVITRSNGPWTSSIPFEYWDEMSMPRSCITAMA